MLIHVCCSLIMQHLSLRAAFYNAPLDTPATFIRLSRMYRVIPLLSDAETSAA
jgi:hypothetical protein